jgi:hypothetical protein
MAATSVGFTEMALDPRIILQAGNIKTPGYAETMELRESIGARRDARLAAEQQRQQQQAQMMRLRDVGTKAAAGDIAGARSTALQGGDFDLAAQLDKLDDRAKAAVHAKVSAAAPVFATALQEKDPAKRTTIIAAALPTLKANGYTDEEIAKINPSDEFLAGAVGNAQTIDSILSRQDKAHELDVRMEEARSARAQAERNAYISAGIVPPGNSAVGTTSAPSAGRTQFGWTPRARNGGDNTDEAVDGKIAGMAKHLGIDPTTPFPPDVTDGQIAEALTLSEGGTGSLADRNNNPGNLIDPATGKFRRFPTKAAGLQAAAAQVRRNRARGQNTIQSMVEGLPVGGSSTAPAGQQLIPGGRADRQAKADARAEAAAQRAEATAARAEERDARKITADDNRETVTMRKEFDNLPEVKNFKIVRAAKQQVEALARKKDASATDDIAIIFSYMRMLDPNSVVREGEFATAQNAAGIPQQIQNLYNRALQGNRLSFEQRQEMGRTAGRVYIPLRDAYNEAANKYRGYAQDAGIDPGKIAAVAVPTPARKAGTLAANLPTFTPEQARRAPKGTKFKTTDGRVMVR